MVHLPHTAVHLAAVMGAVWFPVAASRAPNGSAITRANKYILAVEPFQPGAVGTRIRTRRVVLCLDIVVVIV